VADGIINLALATTGQKEECMSGNPITCVDCGQAFLWSYGEQRFYKEHKLEAPKRCPECRSHKRVERDPGMRSVVGPPTRPAASADRRWAEAARKAQPPASRTAPPTTARRSAPPAASPRRRSPQARAYQPPSPSWWADPVHRHGAIVLGIALALTILLHAAEVMRDDVLAWVLAWVLAVNAVAVLTYAYDKLIAGTTWTRVPEKVLLLLAFAGGAIGAYAGMRLWNHKTSKVSFRVKFWLVVAAEVALIVAYYVLIVRRS
jgi:uncharacterized membrane protein YsdA (DUF1294 family)